MPLHRFRRQYEQLSQFERGTIIGMMEARWSARRVARQLGHSHCVKTSGSERCAALEASVWSGAAHEETVLQRNGTRSSLVTNLDSISAVMTIAFVCGEPVVNASIPPLLYRAHRSHSWCDGMGSH
ncbi:uncharacterized protein TNCV_3193201 [Trichonephila clavipes]|nr:uncharacterized protein TNCV_3193201 [Trichonephila clavipes]